MNKQQTSIVTHYMHWPHSSALKASGLTSPSKVPCIFRTTGEIVESASNYLRSLATSNPVDSSSGLMLIKFSGRIGKTRISNRTYGESLVNLHDWIEATHRDWKTMNYEDDILNGYQRDMVTGNWSRDRRPLAPSTINLRVGIACSYFDWAMKNGLRSEFFVPTIKRVRAVQNGVSTRGHKPKVIKIRIGAVRRSPMTLHIPKIHEVDKWLKSVKANSGSVKQLMCETVIETAVRREEICQWRFDTLPLNPSDWRVVGDVVMVTLEYGAKGPKYDDGRGDEVGPAREIEIPLALAEKLHTYRTYVRPKLLAKFVKAARSKEERLRRKTNAERRMFLSEASGTPISAKCFYKAWKKSSSLPYASWSPHLGRHFWACTKLLRETSRRLSIPGRLKPDFDTGFGVAHATASDIIKLVLKPQLGHMSEETVEIYLVWIMRALRYDSYVEEYFSSLGEYDENGIDGLED